jgi:hypothetical protein
LFIGNLTVYVLLGCTYANVANADWVCFLHAAEYELLSASSLNPTLQVVDQFIYKPCPYTLQASCLGVPNSYTQLSPRHNCT